MKRREFLKAGVGASAALMAERAGVAQTANAANAGKPRQYYELRKYLLEQGPQVQGAAEYVGKALIPAMNRMGISPVGAFNLQIGPETPALYVLLPSTNLETLVGARLRLERDEQFQSAAASFWNAPATSPAFVRVESTLLIAFEGWPEITVPPTTAQKAKRIFQMRTYESPSLRDHARKVQMFHAGEFEIFRKSGFWNVFFGDALIGARLPHLTYMLSYTEVAQMDELWGKFRDDPEWKKLQQRPEFSYEPIVSNITNLLLAPTEYSQI
ncbi:MAG TPA: NIPSNAP family protein [Acidobacteriaceae bacterium]|nr:NIPSNAP family protein [Acidobacteriaceae bacterium]